jgi:cell division septal protein FtsQ
MNQSSARRRTYDVVVTREVLGIRQKPKKRRRPFPRIRLLSLPILIGLGATMYHFLTSPAYTVQSVTVRGNDLVTAEAIYQVGQLDGQNLFLLNTRAAAEAIESLPYIERTWVHAKVPAQVSIVVQEYRPHWVWIAGTNRFWIDETGQILPDNHKLKATLTVTEPSDRWLPIGSRLAPHLVEMIDTIDYLLPDVEQIEYDEKMGFTLTVGPGWPIRIGNTPDRLATKMGILNSLLPELMRQEKDVDFIDLRFPEQPYYRLKP